QEYFRKSKPPLLAIWGKNDPFFIPAGAKAFRKDPPGAKIQFLDTRHFAPETHVVEIALRDERLPPVTRYCETNRRKQACKMSAFPQNCAIVLVHGAWADGSCWGNVILPLQQQGISVICAPIPLTSLTNDIAALNHALERTSGPVILAGHAYAGAV